MTENQWPEASAGSPLDQYGNTPTHASAEPETYVTKKDAAKEETSKIAGEAAGVARNVAQTARLEAGNVATEAKSSAQDLLQQAKRGVSSQAGEQQRKAADGIRSLSSQLHAMADSPEQQGMASDLVREVAGRASSVASWVEGTEPSAMLADVQSFARRKPGTFLLLAAGAGILAGRVARGLKAETPHAQRTVRPRPEQAPAAGAKAPSWGAEPVYQDQAAAAPTYGETIYGEPARPSYSGTESGGVPLKDPDDPFSDVRAAERQP
ncbi:hypothetical protein [Pseudarthrobacter siccitolerans]|nr:hypothetical protein [Pseudarthrobacter siccitolerans]